MKSLITLGLMAFGALLAWAVIGLTATASSPPPQTVPNHQIFNGDLTVRSPATVVRDGNLDMLFGVK